MQWSKQIALVAGGDRKAQEWLFAWQGKLLYALCRRYISSAPDAEEVLMAGFLKIYNNIGDARLTTEGALTAWMRKIMINECLQWLRKRHSFWVVGDAQAGAATAAETADAPLHAKVLFALLEMLPPGYKTVFNLYVVEGYTHREIAALLGISEGASKSQLNKARARLAQLWKQQNTYYGMGKAGQ